MKPGICMGLVLGWTVFLTAGCGAAQTAGDPETAEEKAGHIRIIEAFEDIILPMDQDGAIYETALKETGAYLSGEAEREAALEAVKAALTELSERAQAIEVYEIEEELSGLLAEYGILREEMDIFANGERASTLSGYIVNLEALSEYLEYAEEFDYEYENALFWYECDSAILDALRGYYFYSGVNYWFAEWSEAQAADAQARIVSSLQTYLPEGYIWETDKAVIEKKVNRYLDIYDEYVSLASGHLGEAEEDLLLARKYYQELKALIAVETKLAKLYDISDQLELISDQVEAAQAAQDEEKLAELKLQFEALVEEYEALLAEEE